MIKAIDVLKINTPYNIKSIPTIKRIPLARQSPTVGGSYKQKEYYSLITYFGGKFNQLGKTLPYIEKLTELNQAHTYLECFGGGGRCILNLDTINNHFNTIIYNEYDAGLCSLFEIVSKQETADILANALNQTEYTEELFNRCKAHRQEKELSALDKAAITFILCQMSYNSNMKTFCKEDYDPNVINQYYNAIERIRYAPEHLQRLRVSNKDYKELMQVYGKDPRVVKYLDPPYHPTCRNQDTLKVYPNELTQEQHKELVEILCQSRCWVMSGYDPAQYGCEDYKPLEAAGAIKESIGNYLISSSNIGDKQKEEFIWYKT